MRRGASLASTLLLSGLLLMLAFTLAAASLAHVNVGVRLSNGQHARNLAESALSRAIERVLATNGSYGSAGDEEVRVQFPGSPAGSRGFLTFSPARATAEQVGVSTFNLRNDGWVRGYGNRVVPGESVHLVAFGTSGGAVRRMEAILGIPTYRYALSNNGPLESEGDLVVAGVEQAADAVYANDQADRLLPGHIGSNSALRLLPLAPREILVKGDARAGATIDLGGGAEVEGELRPNDPGLALPEVDLNDFDPARFGSTVLIEEDADGDGAVSVGNIALEGLVKQRVDLTADRVRLAPDGGGAIVYVDGDVTIRQGLRGVGVLIATGDLTIRDAGETSLTAENTAALLAGGDILITGQDALGAGSRRTRFFQGLVYGGGKISLENVTVVGSVVGNGQPDDALVLKDANVVHCDAVLDFEFDFPLGPGGGFAGAVELRLSPELLQDPRNSRATDPDAVEEAFFRNDGYDPGQVRAGHFSYYDLSGNPLSVSEAADRCLAQPPPEGFATWDAYLAAQGCNLAAGLKPAMEECLNGTINGKAANDLRKAVGELDRLYRDQVADRKGRFVMEPNRFVQFNKKARVLLWREI
ncbi:MAG: hypothetical protein AB1758_04290 [Candidatus Eremiobacterota bacterium]